ncbi:MAG TPA: hypothetical protein VH092_26810, partial [Urbifossiella sp.]|nr:hypothetical protein [Urbifossiella sp.]
SLAAAAGLAQQPAAPPQPLPAGVGGSVVPATAVAPAPAAEAPIGRFEPLAAFPVPTQQAVRGAASGTNWLLRMNQVQGRFVYGYRPAVRQPMEGDHDFRQAIAVLALAQGAKFTSDARSTAVASQAVLTLLAATRIDPADPTSRVPIHALLGCNRVGFAAVLALAIYDLPGADDRLIMGAEQLCGFLRKACRPDGSVQYAEGNGDAAGVNEYPGLALAAIIAGNRVRPEAWKVEAAAKGLAFYRVAFRVAPHPLFASTLTPAFAELHLQTRNADAAAAVFELNDWLCGLQYPAANPRNPAWAGGFRGVLNGQPADAEPTFENAATLASLGWAYAVTARNPDLARADRYRQAAQDAAQFVAALQYAEPNTRHFENTFRANVLIGGFHFSPSDGDLRIDVTGRCVSGLLRYLASGAER